MTRLTNYPTNPEELKEDLVAAYPSYEDVIRSSIGWSHLNSKDTLVDFFRNSLSDNKAANDLSNQSTLYLEYLPTLLLNARAPFTKLVFVGASIMEQTFGSTLGQRSTEMETYLGYEGASVEVYVYAVGGATVATILDELETALTDHPDNALFYVHIGGNNVSAGRPYPGGLTTLTQDYNRLLAQVKRRPGRVILSDLTFRDYNNTTADNESAGSAPYNDHFFKPLFQGNTGLLARDAYYDDGTPVSCLYEWSYGVNPAFLASDNIHPENPEGRLLLRRWLSRRLAPILLGQDKPAQIVRTDMASELSDLWFALAAPTGYQYGVNNSGIGDDVTSGVTSWGPHTNLINLDGTLTEVSILIEFDAADGSNGAGGVGYNDSGRGGDPFDETNILADEFTAHSIYFGADIPSLTVTISGLEPLTSYDLEVTASRGASGPRSATYTLDTGDSDTLDATLDPPQSISLSGNSNASGVMVMTVTHATASQYGYLGGFRITKS